LLLDAANTVALDCLQTASETSRRGTATVPSTAPPEFSGDWSAAEKYLEEGYKSLLLDATLLQEEYDMARPPGRAQTKEFEEAVKNLDALSDGRVSTAVSSNQPLSVREIAREVMKDPSRCQELLHEDFDSIVQWAASQEPPLDKDQTRQRLVKRKGLLEAALPDSMKTSVESEMTIAERQSLQKQYANDSTLLGDRIEDIPRENFFVSEDNYAWDMEELVQALAHKEGVMRNAYSGDMFSEADIRKILRHPLAQVLRPLQLAQDALKKGVRPTTIEWVAKVGSVMRQDQSPDAGPSLKAMDEFLAYSATLPEGEQKTLDSLKIPAKDSHTGQAFDYTIGASVKDAKANVTCFHKVGTGSLVR
jgi:hypothetical protein